MKGLCQLVTVSLSTRHNVESPLRRVSVEIHLYPVVLHVVGTFFFGGGVLILLIDVIL